MPSSATPLLTKRPPRWSSPASRQRASGAGSPREMSRWGPTTRGPSSGPFGTRVFSSSSTRPVRTPRAMCSANSNWPTTRARPSCLCGSRTRRWETTWRITSGRPTGSTRLALLWRRTWTGSREPSRSVSVCRGPERCLLSRSRPPVPLWSRRRRQPSDCVRTRRPSGSGDVRPTWETRRLRPALETCTTAGSRSGTPSRTSRTRRLRSEAHSSPSRPSAGTRRPSRKGTWWRCATWPTSTATPTTARTSAMTRWEATRRQRRCTPRPAIVGAWTGAFASRGCT